MSVGVAEPPRTPEPVEPKTNVFQRIAGVLFAPVDTFREIARRPDVVAPIIVLVVISFATTLVLVPRMDFEEAFRQQMAQSGQEMSEADLERVMGFTNAFAKVVAYTGPLWGILFYLIVAGVLLLAFRLFGGEGTFKQAFSVTLYAWIPLALYSIVVAIVGMTRSSINPTTMPTLVKSNPGFLVDMTEQPVLFALLSSFDIFTIWTIVLLIFGFAAVSRVSAGKSAAIVVSLWLVTIVVKTGFAAIGQIGSS